MGKAESGSNKEKRNSIVERTQLLSAILDTQKTGKQWNGQLLLNKNLVAQKIYSETRFNIQLDLQETTQTLEEEHFYHKTAKPPRRRGVSPGVNADVTSLFVGVAYEVGNMEDIEIVRDELYKQLVGHFPESINTRLVRAEKIRNMQNLFALGVNLRKQADSQSNALKQDQLEKRAAILAKNPYTAALLANNFDPSLTSESYQLWIDKFSLLYRQKREEITRGKPENWLSEEKLLAGLKASFPSKDSFEINAPFLAAILVIAAWEVGEQSLPFLKQEIVERVRSYIFDAYSIGHPYLTDEERKIFDQFFELGLQIRKDQKLPDIGDIPGLQDL